MSLSKKLSDLDRRVLPVEAIDRAGSAVSERSGLRRSPTDRHVAGVCGGIATQFGVDARPVRLAFLLFAPAALWIYILAWIFVPVGAPVAPSAEHI